MELNFGNMSLEKAGMIAYSDDLILITTSGNVQIMRSFKDSIYQLGSMELGSRDPMDLPVNQIIRMAKLWLTKNSGMN